MPRRKAEAKPEPIEVEAPAIVTPTCLICGQPTEVNTPERWVNEIGNYEKAWWNNQDFYCPTCHVFMNTREPLSYVQPSGKNLEGGRRVITLMRPAGYLYVVVSGE